MKQNCWKKKLDYVFAQLKESFMQKDEKKNKKKIKAEKAKQKKARTFNLSSEGQVHGNLFEENGKSG